MYIGILYLYTYIFCNSMVLIAGDRKEKRLFILSHKSSFRIVSLAFADIFHTEPIQALLFSLLYFLDIFSIFRSKLDFSRLLRSVVNIISFFFYIRTCGFILYIVYVYNRYTTSLINCLKMVNGEIFYVCTYQEFIPRLICI